MAQRQYLIPGGEFVNETTSTLEYLVPGSVFLDETSTAAAGGGGAVAASPFNAFLLLTAYVPHTGTSVPRPVGVF